MTIRFALLAVLLLATSPVRAQTSTRAAPPHCGDDATYSVLDFWVGDWRVVDSTKTEVGRDRVERIVGGCALIEHWRDADGGEGKSLFYYATDQRRWKQVWVTDQATRVGGFKEKRLIARFPDGGVRFQGELVGATTIVLDRTTLTPMKGGAVHQLIEISTDGGRSWRATFDAMYLPASAPKP